MFMNERKKFTTGLPLFWSALLTSLVAENIRRIYNKSKHYSNYFNRADTPLERSADIRKKTVTRLRCVCS